MLTAINLQTRKAKRYFVDIAPNDLDVDELVGLIIVE
jgi:hypothetical protein